jgi:uncharacterized protein (TIGR03067 family)
MNNWPLPKAACSGRLRKGWQTKSLQAARRWPAGSMALGGASWRAAFLFSEVSMKRAAVLLVGLLFLGASVQGAGDATKDDLKRLEGKWKFVERVIDGKKGDLKGTWTITGNKLSYASDSDVWAVLHLDATTKPKTFDFDHDSKDPKKAEKGIKGIYAIDGDTLKVCVAIPGKAKDRPKSFESKEGSGLALTVLKRVKDKE